MKAITKLKEIIGSKLECCVGKENNTLRESRMCLIYRDLISSP